MSIFYSLKLKFPFEISPHETRAYVYKPGDQNHFLKKMDITSSSIVPFIYNVEGERNWIMYNDYKWFIFELQNTVKAVERIYFNLLKAKDETHVNIFVIVISNPMEAGYDIFYYINVWW